MVTAADYAWKISLEQRVFFNSLSIFRTLNLIINFKLNSSEFRKLPKGSVHKRRPQSKGLYSADKDGGDSDADVRTFWCKKTPDFSKFLVFPHRTDKREGGWASEDKGEAWTKEMV